MVHLCNRILVRTKKEQPQILTRMDDPISIPGKTYLCWQKSEPLLPLRVDTDYRTFGDDGNVLYLDGGGALTQVYTFIKSHENVHLRSVHFITYKVYSDFKSY